MSGVMEQAIKLGLQDQCLTEARAFYKVAIVLYSHVHKYAILYFVVLVIEKCLCNDSIAQRTSSTFCAFYKASGT